MHTRRICIRMQVVEQLVAPCMCICVYVCRWSSSSSHRVYVYTCIRVQVVERLVAVGAEVDAPLSDGKTALMLACKNGRQQAAELLLQAHTHIYLCIGTCTCDSRRRSCCCRRMHIHMCA